MSSRLRPLHTCGVSFLIMAHSTCSRLQNLDGRFGSTARNMVRRAKLLNPLIFVMQYLWLLFLSFIDDRLLAIANIIVKNFPPFKPIFDKIDDLLRLIETFPRSFDDAVEKLPCFNQVLFLEWAVTHAVSWLKSMISILMNCRRDDTRVKEILVDMNYNKGYNGSESADKSENCSKETISSISESQAAMDKNIKCDAMKHTYIEVLKMGTKEEGVDEDCKENENGNHKRSLVEGTRDQSMEDNEEFKNDNKGDEKNDQNYDGVLSNEDNSEVKGEKDCECNAMKGTYKEVLKMGTRGEEDDGECKENEKGTYKRSLVEGKRDPAMEDKEEFKSDKGRVKDTESCKKGDENNHSENPTEKMEESVEKEKEMKKYELRTMKES